MMFKSWIRDLTEEKGKRASETGIYGVPSNQRGWNISTENKSILPGQEEIINFNIKEFLNKYRKKSS